MKTANTETKEASEAVGAVLVIGGGIGKLRLLQLDSIFCRSAIYDGSGSDIS